MYGGELIVALVAGITLSIIFADYFGIIPAGIIVPPYLALVFDRPATLAGILLVALLAYFLVNFLGRFIILFGRRKFGAMVLTALLLKLILYFLFPLFYLDVLSLQGMGVVIPGLIANSIDRQGFAPTLLSMFFLGGITYLILLLYLFLL
ncbi:MAG: poly-gamma-glutamate biosynthesis protein PgsC [Candidatus Contubernalis sp.]|nr:poly-gamma-glutamate biosynthesis protein PgsC [Candidatus Contubernalis sp.]